MTKINILKTILTFIVIFIVIYVVVFICFMLREKYYEWKVNTYDLDNNGIFTKDEQTEEQQIWFSRYINDGGLALLPIYTFFSALFGSVLIIMVIKIVKYISVKNK